MEDKPGSQAIKVVFQNDNIKQKWLKSKEKMQLNSNKLGFSTNNKVFLNPDLTKFNLELLKATKVYKNEKKYKYCWFSNGNIFLRKDDQSRVILVETEKQLKN